MADIGVYFRILEALLQIVVDCLVRYLADQREIGYTDLLLLGRFEDGLLAETSTAWAAFRWRRSGSILLATCALRDSLCEMSARYINPRMDSLGYSTISACGRFTGPSLWTVSQFSRAAKDMRERSTSASREAERPRLNLFAESSCRQHACVVGLQCGWIIVAWQSSDVRGATRHQPH